MNLKNVIKATAGAVLASSGATIAGEALTSPPSGASTVASKCSPTTGFGFQECVAIGHISGHYNIKGIAKDVSGGTKYAQDWMIDYTDHSKTAQSTLSLTTGHSVDAYFTYGTGFPPAQNVYAKWAFSQIFAHAHSSFL